MSKPFNRFQREKAMNKARRIVQSWMRYASDTPPEKIEEMAHHIRDNRKACSCHMCRNPRHSAWSKNTSKLTLQEIKKQNWKDEIDE